MSTPRSSVAMPVLLLLALTIALAPGADAQDAGSDPAALFAPAPQLRKLDYLLGNSTSKGIAIAPGGQESPWTAVTTVKRVLGDHFLQEDTRIEAGAFMVLVFRTFYGWDRERKRYVAFGFGNVGPAYAMDLLVDGRSITTARATVENGEPVLERSHTTYKEDGSFEFVTERAVGTGPLGLYVKGGGKRGGEGYSLKKNDFQVSFYPAPGQMARFAAWTGTSHITGSVIPFPGMEPMSISGTEKAELWFGGSLLSSRVTSDPAPGVHDYEGLGFLYWDDADRVIRQQMLDNMGTFVSQDLHAVSERQVVAIMANLQLGVPGAERAIIELREDGSISEVKADRLAGVAKVSRNFHGKYVKVEKKAAPESAEKPEKAAPAESDSEK